MDSLFLLQQLKALNERTLFKSAELLGDFLLSDDSTSAIAETYACFADSLFSGEQYSRALDYYQQAATKKAISLKPHELKWKIAQCYLKLHEDRLAMTVLESVDASQRTVEMHACLGRLYHQQGALKEAVTCYVEAVKQCPYALECVLALIELGIGWTDLKSLYTRNPNDAKWLGILVESHQLARQFDYKGALSLLHPLSQKFNSRNLYLLGQMASYFVHTEQVDNAYLMYYKMRKQDPKYVNGVGTFARILKVQNKRGELHKLSLDLAKAAPNRPETWAVASVYNDMKGHKDKSLALLDRALALDARYNEGLFIKGSLMLSLGLHKESAAAYRKAYTLHKDISALRGLVWTYISMQKYQEAASIAQEAHKYITNNAQVATLYGVALSNFPHERDKARGVLDSVLALDPTHIDAVLALARLDVAERKYSDALTRLESRLANGPNELVHIQFAEVLGQLQRYEEAMHHYHSALALNPGSERAKAGLEQVERAMHGEDADEADDVGSLSEEGDDLASGVGHGDDDDVLLGGDGAAS